MISSLLRSHEGFFPQGWQQFLEEHCRNVHGFCTANQRRKGGTSSTTRKNRCKQGINLLHSPMNYSSSSSGSFMKELTGLTFLHFPFRCECLIAQRTFSPLTFLLSAPFCLLSRALLLPPDSQVLIRVSSDPPHTPLALYLNTFTIPALFPLISSLLFTFSRISAFLSNSSKPSVVGSIIRNTVTESWQWKSLLRTLVESLLLAPF